MNSEAEPPPNRGFARGFLAGLAELIALSEPMTLIWYALVIVSGAVIGYYTGGITGAILGAVTGLAALVLFIVTQAP